MPEDTPPPNKRFVSAVIQTHLQTDSPLPLRAPGRFGRAPPTLWSLEPAFPTPSCSGGTAPPLFSPVSPRESRQGLAPWMGFTPIWVSVTGWSPLLTRCSLTLRALPSGCNPFCRLEVAEPGRQPKGACHICCCDCGEDGGEAEKGTGKLWTPLALRSHFSFSFRLCSPHLSLAAD